MSVDMTLSYPVTSVPTVLFHEDGTLRKTNKADLANKLEEKIDSSNHLPVTHK